MKAAVTMLFEEYRQRNGGSSRNAIAELIQHIALLGLSRTDFFTNAAFYGGTALRMIHGLERFSEDLDFSLERPNPEFSLSPYLHDVGNELKAFGFTAEITVREKRVETPIESAFIKI